MTTETQILKELVEAVSRPDWWAIGITAVNAVIVIVLTFWQLCLNKRQTQIQERQNELQAQQVKLQEQQNQQQEYQTKLQEQQIRQQEYDIYSRLYKLVKMADDKIDFFLYSIRSIIPLAPYSTTVAYEQQLQEITALLGELTQNRFDFEIKFSKDFFDTSSYQRILTHMQFILGQMNELAKSGETKFKSHSAAFDTDSDADIACVNHIIACITNINVINAHRNALLDFVNQKKELRANGNDILAKIRERCKVE